MEITGVRVTHPDGTSRDYPLGRAFTYDGFGDLLITGADGQNIASRKRPSVDDVELLTAATAS